MKMKLGGKLVIGALILGAVGFAGSRFLDSGYFKNAVGIASSVPTKIDLPTASGNTKQEVSNIAVDKVSTAKSFKVQVLAWNAESGITYANGGPTTASGSIIDQHGLKVNLERQDDYNQMTASLAAFAKEYASGNKNPSNGVPFVVIMGDAYPGFARGANEALKPFNQNVEAIAMAGFSRGEDKCMRPDSPTC